MTKTPMTRIECAMTDEGLKSFKPALGRCSETCVVGRGEASRRPPPYLTRLLSVVARNGKKAFESSSIISKLFQSIFRSGRY